MLNDIERKIITAMARTLFCLAWADYQEQVRGESLRGEIADQAPETPQDVLNAAHYVAGMVAQMNGKSLFFLVRDAMNADGRARWLIPDSYVEEFGSDLAMMVTGQGVSWFDDHAEFPLKTPQIEWTHFDLDPEDYPDAEAISENASDKREARRIQRAEDGNPE